MSENNKLMEVVLSMIESNDKVAMLTDKELSDQVIERVWGSLAWNSQEDWLLNELIRRFDTTKGINRDDV